MRGSFSRRQWLAAAAATVQPVPGWIESVERTQLWSNLDGRSQTWFHPRICCLPTGQLLMTIQVIGGSDYFGPVHWSVSDDAGRSWTRPVPIPGMGRRNVDGGIEE
ncbi:MAG TPA: sialidase family protein, partial [Bryobacteraceae bacterium]|nr:sialidase family protein [Bryobacteraceae bacterium]